MEPEEIPLMTRQVRGTITVENVLYDLVGFRSSRTITLPFVILESEPASQGKMKVLIEVDGTNL